VSEPPTALDAHAGALVRHSHGLEQFSGYLQEHHSKHVLDLGDATQANVSFITGLGHRLYSGAFMRALDAASSGWPTEPSAQDIGTFLNDTLGFPEARLDAVLLWDALEFLPGQLLRATVERLLLIVKPGGRMLAFFHADEMTPLVPVYSYRIVSNDSLQLAPRDARRPLQRFNNRGVEKLFERCHSVKFFLARDSLREVIVRR
jgi:hypothetical protein